MAPNGPRDRGEQNTALQALRLAYRPKGLKRAPTMDEVSDATGYATSSLSQAEHGHIAIGTPAAVRLAAYYGITFEELRRAWLETRRQYLQEHLEAVELELKAPRRKRA